MIKRVEKFLRSNEDESELTELFLTMEAMHQKAEEERNNPSNEVYFCRLCKFEIKMSEDKVEHHNQSSVGIKFGALWGRTDI